VANNQYAIIFENVSLVRNGKLILDKINWRVKRGERSVILGLNGSGKTTLLKLVAGYGYPSGGSVEVLGERFGEVDLRELRKRVGWVHMDLKYEIPPFMTAEEVVATGLRGSLAIYDSLSIDEKRDVEKFLSLMEALRLKNRKFITLSTGERQRVLISRAMAANPEILLLDEPCLGLDPLSREDFLNTLQGLLEKEKDITAVYVTHHLDEITGVFQSVTILKNGKISKRGQIGDIPREDIIRDLYGPGFRAYGIGIDFGENPGK